MNSTDGFFSFLGLALAIAIALVFFQPETIDPGMAHNLVIDSLKARSRNGFDFEFIDAGDTAEVESVSVIGRQVQVWINIDWVHGNVSHEEYRSFMLFKVGEDWKVGQGHNNLRDM